MIHIEQEPDRVPAKPLAWSAGTIIVAIIASLGGTAWLIQGAITDALRVDEAHPDRIESTMFTTPAPAEALAGEAHAKLTTYGWVDRSRNTIRVPLDVAIEHYLEHHK